MPIQPDKDRPETELIVKVTNYVDNGGRMIEWREPEVGQPPEGFVYFIGHTQLQIHDHAGNNVGQRPVSFPILSKSLKEAFEQFDDLAYKAVEEIHTSMQEQQRQRQGGIVLPGGGRG